MHKSLVECENHAVKDLSNQLIHSILYNFSLSFFPNAISDYLKINAIITTRHEYLCKQVVAIGMLYFIKKNFYELCEVVLLFQMTTLLSFLLKTNGFNPYLSQKVGECLRLYIRFHSNMQSATGIVIMLLSILAGYLANDLEKKIFNAAYVLNN